MVEQNEKYGITGPMTLKKSSHESIELSNKLEEYLKSLNFYESEESAQTRERVLGRLDFLLKQFVDSLAPPHEKKTTGGKIFTFGSYRLGVHNRGADIDALCVVPKHVNRKDFFTIFYENLRNDPDVKDLSKIEDAYVPLIKMKFSGIPIDLTFAKLNIQSVKENITLLNDSLLKSIHEKSIVSLNGSRVTDAMLNLIPSTDVFHSALRSIKLWAKRRYIYGATYGYFGGVAFSICVARICQMYPNYCAYDIICKFFETYSTWKWPNPVILKEVQNLNYHYKVWDPKIHPADKYNKMPVITPVYPTMCSTSNVTQSTSVLIINEITRAHEILKNSKNFIKIFNFTNFFRKYKLFIEIVIKCLDKDDYLLWNGFVESKVRFLANKLENIENIVGAIPFPKCFVHGNEGKDDLKKTENNRKNNIEKNYDFYNAKKIKISDEVNLCNLKKENSVTMVNNRSIQTNETKELNTLELTSQNEYEEKSDSVKCSSSFFIAIDVIITKTTGKKFYVDGPIKEFLNFMNSWEKKTDNMTIDIKAKKKKEVLNFVKNDIEIGDDD